MKIFLRFFAILLIIPLQNLEAYHRNELKLAGTIVHTESKKSIASINNKAYQRQEWIKPQFEVIEVRRFKVRVQDKKSQEFFWLKTSPYQASLAIPSQGIFKGKKRSYHVEQSRIDKVTANLPAFLADAGSRPVKNKQGEIIGFELTFIKKGGAFDGLGLHQGDILKEVNGLKLDSVDSALKIYQQLRDSSLIELEMERKGRSKKVRYEIKSST